MIETTKTRKFVRNIIVIVTTWMLATIGMTLSIVSKNLGVIAVCALAFGVTTIMNILTLRVLFKAD